MFVQSLEMAEQRMTLIKEGDARTKPARISQCEDALREVSTMRKSFLLEFQLLPAPQKQPYRTALEGYDRRVANIEQQIKWERAAYEKQALVGAKGDAGGPATTDQMLKATTDLQNKAGAALERTRKRAGETLELGKEVVVRWWAWLAARGRACERLH